ncbi:MAG: ferritin-like domain-containing protein [Burkholderiales bacterium]|nr:MAG: ferritin-like domain-containing protein [Burkholderiales bacterium]
MTAGNTTILDEPEHRFPLDMSMRAPRIHELYAASNRSQWDPRTDVDWDALRPEEIPEANREAARLWWSRRGWGEYGAVSESPALIVRFYRDRLPPEVLQYFAIRSQEEARHAEACVLMAEKLGGWIEQPEIQEFETAVSTHGVRSMALDPDTSVEAIMGALVCCLEEYAFDWFRLMVETTTHPVANRVLKLIMRDEVRHCAFGWYWLESRVPHMSADEIKRVERAAIATTEQVELTGYRVPWLAPDSEATRRENEIDRLTFEAGLGATVEEVEAPVFVACVQRVRERFRPLGIELPQFRHPRLGAF